MADFDYDVVVMGSGFGGSVTALRLTEKGYRVGVIEAGRRFTTRTLPTTQLEPPPVPVGAARSACGASSGSRSLRDVAVLSGAGVGGGSLVYANTLYEPLAPFYTDPQWGHITDWRAELAPFYDQAKRMLGVERGPGRHPGRRRTCTGSPTSWAWPTRTTARRSACGSASPASRVPDPYFGGEGPDKVGCTGCGALHDRLPRRRQEHARPQLPLPGRAATARRCTPSTQVVDLEPIAGGGWLVHTERSGAVAAAPTADVHGAARWSSRPASSARSSCCCGSRSDGPAARRLSDRLGDVVRTNSEAIVGAVGPHDRSPSCADGRGHHLVDPSRRHHPHRAGPLRAGRERHGPAHHDPRRRRRQGPPPAAVPRPGRCATRWRSCGRCRCAGGRSGR